MSASLTLSRSVSILRPTSSGRVSFFSPAADFRPHPKDHDENAFQQDRLSGRARRQFASRRARRLSAPGGAAVRDVRGRARQRKVGRGQARHDPHREFGGGPRRRHSSPAPRFRPLYRRRAFRAGAASAADAARRQARRAQDRAQPHHGARPVPQGDRRAQAEAGDRGGYGGRRAPCARARRPHPGRDRLEPRRRDLRAEDRTRRHRGRRAQHHALRRARRQAGADARQRRARW